MNLQTIKRQQGIATVLIVLLVGVALSASTLGVIYSVKSTQNKQVTSHASSNAQSAAWALAEATRAYLMKLEPAEFDNLRAEVDAAGAAGLEIPMTLDGPLAHLSKSKVIANSSYTDPVSGKPHIEITVNAVDSVSKSATTLNVVYAIVAGSAGKQCYPEGKNRFNGDVIGQNIDFKMTGDLNEIIVDGSYGSGDSNLHSIRGIERYKVTGDLSLSGSGNDYALTELQANGSIHIDIASTNIDEKTPISAGGDITIAAANATLGTVVAGNNINLSIHEGSAINVQAGVKILGKIKGVVLTADGYRVNPVEPGSPLGAINFQSSATISTVLSRADLSLGNNLKNLNNTYSLNDVLFNTYSGTVDETIAARSIICTSSPTIAKAEAGKSIDNCAPIPDATNVETDPEVKTTVETKMIKYVPLDLPPSLIADADSYKANYAFHRVGTVNHVTVQNINGLTETAKTYKLLDDNTLETLAGEKTGFNICGNATEKCIDFNDESRILESDDTRAPRTTVDDRGVIEAIAPKGLWTITKKTAKLAPGVYYFDRDLLITGINDSNFLTTIMSAGHIMQTEEVRLLAINAVPEEVLCLNQNLSVDYKQHIADVNITPIATETYYPLQNGVVPYPTNYCKITNGSLARDSSPDEDFVGQFALMAGQENNDEDPVSYQGGNIYFTSSLGVFGRVIAGNTIKLESPDGLKKSNAQIFGLIGSEARAAGIDNAQNDLTGTIDVHTDFYTEVLNKGDPDGGGECSPNDAVKPASTLIWSRYR
ncbi:hypothetical protein [Marinagarivorans cellulosilyticus]|uniref:Uncharacterized protein n=1 Tax=Marinagarivorans cellulosilyticus TaxID=2721545 RepID=A0AAN2BKX5_9GAMM|nr:hypothetical protein [Marinagarivorans cellulosilyticus]BCD98538.1 hypothetical protein MARGE09_P2739 [Marinagarivorans cellulosilyticus]